MLKLNDGFVNYQGKDCMQHTYTLMFENEDSPARRISNSPINRNDNCCERLHTCQQTWSRNIRQIIKEILFNYVLN
jgi:hypothetical protein